MGSEPEFAEPSGIPGRSARPLLLPHTRIKPGALNTRAGHAALRTGSMVPRVTGSQEVFAFSRIERRERVALTPEPDTEGRVGPDLAVEDLDGRGRAGLGVTGAVHRRLPASADAFLRPNELKYQMEQVGLHNVTYTMLMFNTVALHVGTK